MAMAYTLRVCRDIMEERVRQDQLKAAGKFQYTLADAGMQDVDRLAALIEEVGEAATALLEINHATTGSSTRADLRKELVQVAAVATAWCEHLDDVEDILRRQRQPVLEETEDVECIVCKGPCQGH